MPSFAFKIESGKVQGKQSLWSSIKRLFAGLPDGEYLWPHPEKAKLIRSLQQNAYMFGVVYKYISEFTGYETSKWNNELGWVVGLDKDEVHSEMGKLFLSYEKNGRQYVMSTTKLTTAQMENYLANIRQWAAQELCVYIPMPNESEYPYDFK